jgi:opacity protein-like surface antigen
MQRFLAAIIAIVLILLSANAASAETNVCNAGIGGTGIQRDGIGGTGNQSEGIGGTGIQANSGVGGTGAQANSGVGGTGIVGIITGFASICVNGLEVHYDALTQVDIDGLPATIDALNIGQLVAIESSNKDNLLRALQVSVSHIMVGKIDKVDAAQNTVEIMGQTIHLNSNTIGGADLKQNQIVKVSGLTTANSAIHALRIDLATTNTPSSITGVLDQSGKINGVNIANADRITIGRVLHASGSWDGRSLHAEHINENATQRVLRNATDVVIQGIAPARTGQQFNMQNHTINVDANTKIEGKSSGNNQTLIVRGKLDRAGKINARSIEYSGEDKILERGGGKNRPNAPDKSSRTDSGKVRNASEKMENKDRTERLESVERPEKVEHAERPEKIEKAERPEKVERPERRERAERHEDD